MNLIDRINGLKAKKGFQPVSFHMHCRVGKILDEGGPNVQDTSTRDLSMLDSDEMPYLP